MHDPIPAGERARPVSVTTSRPVTLTTSGPVPFAATPPASPAPLRSSVETVAGTAASAGAGALGSIADAAAQAGRRLAGGLHAAAGAGAPLPARDLGVPMGVLALFGAYLAVSRWLDRGGLPMTIADGREDDVQLVL